MGLRGYAILIGDATCTYKSGGFLLRRGCSSDAVGQCVYCGEPFCPEHGTQHPDYYEVCRRDRCEAKFQDLSNHKDWVVRHHHENLAGRCAADECEEPQDIPCERCGLRFCQPHVKSTSVTVVELLGGESTRSQLLCAHCVARRKLWD